MRLAIFGGTFDPIHNAHLTVAREAVLCFQLDRLLLVPAANPPHKGGTTWAGYEDRCHMAELACSGEPAMEVSRLEEGDQRSYSILTIRKVKATLGAGDTLFFLIGADAFHEICSWYRWREVVSDVEFIVVTRPGHEYAIPPGARVHRLETVALPVSSSDIRLELEAGRDSADLPAPVLAYIHEHRLYRQ
jgi:nicotinate-nucleotide adenylyltransferase